MPFKSKVRREGRQRGRQLSYKKRNDRRRIAVPEPHAPVEGLDAQGGLALLADAAEMREPEAVMEVMASPKTTCWEVSAAAVVASPKASQWNVSKTSCRRSLNFGCLGSPLKKKKCDVMAVTPSNCNEVVDCAGAEDVNSNGDAMDMQNVAGCERILSFPSVQGTECHEKTVHNMERKNKTRQKKKALASLRSFLPKWRYEDFRNVPEKTFRRLTGLRQTHMSVLYRFLGGDPVCKHLKYSYKRGTPRRERKTDMSVMDRLFMTLVRLRRGWDMEDIALLFGVGTSTASTYFYAWLQLLYLNFKRIQQSMFVTRHDQPRYKRPGPFKRFNNFRCVLDTTEIKIEVPSNLLQQGNTYSLYKAGNVILYLIGISCWGTISFVSQGFEGNMSDKEIFERSGILNFLEPRDTLLVDRGFKVRDVTDPAQLYLVHPPFMKNKKTALSREDLILTKNIASSRIYVEHTMRQIKCFNILKKIHNSMLPILDQIVYVCACLVNLDPCHLQASASTSCNDVD